MKIFNWVQRRFTHKDGSAQNTKHSGLVINADETTYENNDFPSMFDGWKGGLLAIGTFGYDPLRDNEVKEDEEPEMESPEKEQVMITDSEEEEEEEDEEVNPLVFGADKHDYVGLFGGGDESKKERTTLAELFSADSVELGMKKVEIMVKENKKNNYKQGFSLAKKLIGDQEAKPIHKLQRLVRRMMKRKIHPDEGFEKQEFHTVDSSQVVLKKCQTTTEFASLLSTQVADAEI